MTNHPSINEQRNNFVLKKVKDMFDVKSGDFHAVKELDPGKTPLISCGNSNNGLIGYFDIPDKNIYSNAITVAYNGQPLTAKFHPYKFGAKDDIAILIPKEPLNNTSMLYIASLLNNSRWRYSYGRKCFRDKLRDFELLVPVIISDEEAKLDENAILRLFPRTYHEFIPTKLNPGIITMPKLTWHEFNILEIFRLQRGDFHSIADLDAGEFMTVSRVTEDNGVVGYYKKPSDAHIYNRGHITISTVGSDAFVQLDDFIATDNVIICTPKTELQITTLFFIAFMLNYQKWRYSYGRQCYLAKLQKINIYLPTKDNKQIDEEAIASIVKQTSYWPYVEKRFINNHFPEKLSPNTLWENHDEEVAS